MDDEAWLYGDSAGNGETATANEEEPKVRRSLTAERCKLIIDDCQAEEESKPEDEAFETKAEDPVDVNGANEDEEAPPPQEDEQVTVADDDDDDAAAAPDPEPSKEDEEETSKVQDEEEEDDDDDSDDDDVQITINKNMIEEAKSSYQTIGLGKGRGGVPAADKKGKFNVEDFDQPGTINGKEPHEMDMENIEDKPWKKPGKLKWLPFDEFF